MVKTFVEEGSGWPWHGLEPEDEDGEALTPAWGVISVVRGVILVAIVPTPSMDTRDLQVLIEGAGLVEDTEEVGQGEDTEEADLEEDMEGEEVVQDLEEEDTNFSWTQKWKDQKLHNIVLHVNNLNFVNDLWILQSQFFKQIILNHGCC